MFKPTKRPGFSAILLLLSTILYANILYRIVNDARQQDQQVSDNQSQNISKPSILERILVLFRLHENVDSILKMLETEPDFDGHGLTLLVTLVTANIRSLRFSDSKLQALSILTKMSQHVANDILLDRVLPYVVSYVFPYSYPIFISKSAVVDFWVIH